MFDWEDKEITSIIWGKEGENEDHIVQYPAEDYGENSKVSDQETTNMKITRKTTEFKNITDSEQGNNTEYYTHGRASADGSGSHLDLSSSTATKLAHENTDENAQVDNGSKFFDNEAEDKDGGNFVEYGWANVGSFDDLDRIISNHDLELWSSTKDVIGCPENPELLSIGSPSLDSGVLKSNHQHLGTKSGVIKNENTHHKHSPGFASTYQQVSSASSYLSDKTRDSRFSMTPQEKIKKLRRRQQMRALLAIRRQQQEITHQDDYPNLELYSQESHLQFVRAGRVEIDQSLSSLISLEVSSPLEQSDSDARSGMMDKTALVDTVVQQFQNVIADLGIPMRLCIRDSLLRLAQGALQRKNNGTTNKISNDGLTAVMEEVSSTKSSARRREGETKTNPIDRVVARLLFHTPPGELVPSPSGDSEAQLLQQ